MRKLFFASLMACFAMLFVGTGCTEKSTPVNDSIVDTLGVDTTPKDSLERLVEETPMPRAADELFDDFIFNYASNRKLQKERTDFPLSVESHGKTTEMTESRWQTERFFMPQGYYTLILNSRKQFNLSKDTSLDHVLIEKIDLGRNSVRTWSFNRVEGLWRMQGIKDQSIAQHGDGKFLEFYQKFATDTAFQVKALAPLVKVSAPDPEDDFSRMEGSVMPEQWPAFAPWMPSDVLYNIVYSDKPYKPSNERIFVIRGVANGLETELTFRRSGENWQLVEMEQ